MCTPRPRGRCSSWAPGSPPPPAGLPAATVGARGGRAADAIGRTPGGAGRSRRVWQSRSAPLSPPHPRAPRSPLMLPPSPAIARPAASRAAAPCVWHRSRPRGPTHAPSDQSRCHTRPTSTHAVCVFRALTNSTKGLARPDHAADAAGHVFRILSTMKVGHEAEHSQGLINLIDFRGSDVRLATGSIYDGSRQAVPYPVIAWS